jgi:hypothetical protein
LLRAAPLAVLQDGQDAYVMEPLLTMQSPLLEPVVLLVDHKKRILWATPFPDPRSIRKRLEMHRTADADGRDAPHSCFALSRCLPATKIPASYL